MKISTLLATTSLAVLGLTTTATAHDDEGWYLRGNLGYGIHTDVDLTGGLDSSCLLYTSPSPRDATLSRMPSSA